MGMHKDILNDFLETYKKFYEGDTTDKYEEESLPKIKEYIEWGGTSELKALSNCSDPNEFWEKLHSFHSEVAVFLFLRDLFKTLSHPTKGYDFEFTFNNEKYRIECVSPKKGESALADIDYPIGCQNMKIHVSKEGDAEHQKKLLRVINSIGKKVEQLKNIDDYKESFNFIFIDIKEIFWRTGASGFSSENLKKLFYPTKDGKCLPKRETKIEITGGKVYSYDYSFCSDKMKYINGIFVADTINLSNAQGNQEVDLYINMNAEKESSKDFLGKIQSSDVFQICIIENQ